MEKNLQSNFTTPEQSKRLLEFGVPAWTADCYYTESGKIEIKNTALDILHTPCWSVGRLMEINDICIIYDDKAWMGIEYPSTKLVKGKLDLPYVEFLVQAIEVATDVLDFSKLNDE